MEQDTGPWMDEVEDAWLTFRVDLAERLSELAAGEVLTVEAGAMTRPLARFGVLEGKGVLAEVVAPDHGTDGRPYAAAFALARLGWLRPDDEGAADAAHWRVADPTAYDDLALLTERTLREVFGVLHPAFLDPATPTFRVAEEQPSTPASYDELVRHVDAALRPLLGEALERDDEGDLAIVTGETVVRVRVLSDAPAVEVSAVLVDDVADPAQALAEVNILNRDVSGATYGCRGRQVLARQRISARPFVPQQLRGAVATALATYDELAGDLVGRIGGHRTRAERHEPDDLAEAVVAADEGAARLSMRTLMHLEVDRPGSVDARLAAHIFRYDQQAILGQITWLRRDGRVALVPLLRQALRVVVEQDARQRSAG